jgi:hypothetical protein
MLDQIAASTSHHHHDHNIKINKLNIIDKCGEREHAIDNPGVAEQPFRVLPVVIVINYNSNENKPCSNKVPGATFQD